MAAKVDRAFVVLNKDVRELRVPPSHGYLDRPDCEGVLRVFIAFGLVWRPKNTLSSDGVWQITRA